MKDLGSKRYIEETLIRVKNISLQRTFDIEGKYAVLITWDEKVEGVSNLQGFRVYRSVNGVDWNLLTALPIQVNYYLDTEFKHFKGQDYYYKVTYISSSGESSLEEAEMVSFDTQSKDVSGMNWRLYNASLEQIRRLNLILFHTGENVVCLIRQFIGPKCSRCYDYVSHKVRDERCPVCFGTGIENGYKMVSAKMHFEPAVLTITRGLEGFIPAYDFRCWLTTFPILNSHDFIIRKRTGERFIINENNKVINQGFLLMQQLRISLLNKDHPIYDVKV